MKKIKFNKIFSLENIICFYIILLPIFDMYSFLHRNIFKIDSSPITIIRPIILILIIIFGFFKLDKSSKIKMCLFNFLILFYSYFHMKIFKNSSTLATLYSPKEELRFLAYYAFGSNIYLYILLFFKNKNLNNLNKSISNDDKKNKEKNIKKINEINLENQEKISIQKINKKINISFIISALIFTLTLYLSMVTKKASYTYFDSKTGYKGFFESGNVLSNILFFIQSISLVIALENIKKEKQKQKIERKENKEDLEIFLPILVFIGITIYNILFLGTRTGKYGSILTIIFFILCLSFAIVRKTFIFRDRENKIRIIDKDKDKNKNNNNYYSNKVFKILIIFLFIIVSLFSIIFIKTKNIKLESSGRKKYLEENQKALVDEKGESLSVTLHIHELNKKITRGEIDEKFLTKEEQQSLIETEEIAKKKKLVGYDRRKAQTIYHIRLLKNQKSLKKIIFGNGYLLHYGEMTLERELLAIVLNFGILGAILFLLPVIYITFMGIKYLLLNLKRIQIKYCILLYALLLSFVLSYYSGAMFYPMSCSALVGIVVYKLFLYIDIKKQIYNYN